MAECRPKNYPKLKDYKPSRFMLPSCHYDAAKADRAVTFIENLRHTKGKWAGKRFWLLPWQEQIIRDVFGIVDEKGNRQFRTAYVEIGKKNGKSELAAAVALYLLFADNEPSAEVYGAAADRQQASIVFDVAHQMVQMTPALLKRCKIMAATKRIVNYGNAGFYQVLSAEVGTKHGLNVSGLVLDEVHAQPNRKLYDVLTKGSGDAREQPLFFLITTAGTDKESICYELHMKALDLLAGRKIDHTFYPVVYGLTDEDDWHDEAKQKIENEAAIAKAEADKQVAITNAEAEAQKTSIAADAQAEANRKLAESLSDTLIDYQKIQKWDGKLPTVSGGNALVSIDPAE